MDFLKNIASQAQQGQSQPAEGQAASSGGGDLFGQLNKALAGDGKTADGQQGGGNPLLGQVNNLLGGGQSGEKKEDALDKGIDYIQEHYLKGGDQSNESAIEQAKDEQIADAIRKGFKSATGKDFPVADK